MKNLLKKSLATLVCGLSFSAANAAPNYDQALTSLRSNPGNYSWIQERSIDSVNFANMVLCFIKASGADRQEVIGKGPYVVAAQEGACDEGSNNSSSASTGSGQVRYGYGVAQSDYDAASNALMIKFWMRPNQSDLEKAQSDSRQQADATHVTIKVSLPANEVGFDQVTYVSFPADSITGEPTTLDFAQARNYGSMVPTMTSQGFTIAMVDYQKDYWNPNGITKWMNLVRSGPRGRVTLLGTVQSKEWDNNAGADVPVQFNLNANDTEFIRNRYNSATSSWDTPICFDRTTFKFTTWNYNLYTEAGALLNINSTIDVTYVANDGSSYRGNYSNDNFWMPDAAQTEIASKGSVNVSVQDQSSATKKDGVVTVRNGSLRKVVNTQNSLSDLDKVILNYWKCPSGGTCSNVQIAWDKASQKFVNVNSGVITTSSPVAYSDLPQGDLWINTNTGINYVIRGIWANVNNTWKVDWSNSANLSNTTKVTSRQEKKLTTAELNALGGVTLNCIGNCPMWDSGTSTIKTYNAAKQFITGASLNQPTNNGTSFGYSYTFNPSTGKLFNDAAGTTALEYTAFKASTVANSNSVQSGPLIPSNVKTLAEISKAAKCNANDPDANTTGVCPWNYENTLPVYYIWRSGERQWEKDWSLTVNGTVPQLDDRKRFTYTCPANKEGCDPGSKSVLDYNGPGRLWGIPNKCVNAENYSEDCTANTKNQQWINKFNLTTSSVNADKTTDFVTDENGTKFLVLPQGSGEYYPVKNTCSLTLGNPLPEVKMTDVFNRAVIDFSPSPLNALTDTVKIRDGELVSN